MPFISNERNWLTWLVKVRILILMVLLAIELAVIRLTPSPLPIAPFLTGMVLWFVLSLFFLFLVSVWSEHRLQAILQVLADLAMVTLVVHVTGGIDSSLNFLYPLVIVVACMLLPRSWGYLSAALAFILFGTVLEARLLPGHSLLCQLASQTAGAAGSDPGQPVCRFRHRLPRRLVDEQAPPGGCAIETCQRRPRETPGAPRKHRAVHERRCDRHRARRTHHPGQSRRPATARYPEAELRGRSVADLFQVRCPTAASAGAMPKSATSPSTGFARPFACWSRP